MNRALVHTSVRSALARRGASVSGATAVICAGRSAAYLAALHEAQRRDETSRRSVGPRCAQTGVVGRREAATEVVQRFGGREAHQQSPPQQKGAVRS